ncbi:type 1 glutamine amidotransferase [Thermovibrio sp.]
MKLVAVKNIEFEDLGTFKEAFEKRGVKVEELKGYEGEIPEPSNYDIVVILGGPMGVYEEDRYPFLKDEEELIKKAFKEGKKVLGICLGAQLIAKAFGGKVYKGEWGKEIGWKPIYPQDDLERIYTDEIKVFHWHGDTFELPKGAVKMASSAMYKNQAFRIGDRIVALQFHLEVEPNGIERWIEAYKEELLQERIGKEEVRGNPEDWKKLRLYGDVFVEYFLRL